MKSESIYRACWDQPLPEDEIHRQQQMKEQLQTGMEVELRGLGRFIYNGTWDTMHTFYPAEGQNLQEVASRNNRYRVKRDLGGRYFIQLPYTLLADEVIPKPQS
ncbi:MAG: hypothetical protein K2H38_11560 [Muribaculaceae bacterium]|nr:hypothetical protein [Muribaculaceae bacterium]